MHNRNTLAAIILLLGTSLPVAAAHGQPDPGKPVQPDDFAWGIELQPTSDTGLLTVELPAAFYTGIARADAGDFRLYNAGHQPLPYRLEQKSARAGEPLRRSVPIFPLYSDEAARSNNLSIRFERNADGTLVDIRDKATDRQTGKTLSGYIVDNSRNTEDENLAVTEIAFELADAGSLFTRSITIQRSDDLKTWTTITDDAVLSKLEFQGQRLEKTEIALPDTRANYLRISSAGSEPVPEFKKITLELVNRQREVPLRWSNAIPLEPAPAEDETANNAYMFDTGGYFPLRRIQLNSNETNMIYRGTLQSRPDKTDGWHNRGQLTRYRIQTDAGPISSDPVRVGPTRDRYWRIVLDYPPAIGPEHLPTVRFAWSPERLFFVAQGEAPYWLAFGNPNIEHPANPGRDVIDLLSRTRIEPAGVKLSARQSLGGSDKLQPPVAPFPLKIVLLWIVLIAGVALMIRMAVKLYGQMGNRKDS